MRSNLLLALFALSLTLSVFAGVTTDPVTGRSTYAYEFDATHNLSICRGFNYGVTACENVPLACAPESSDETLLPMVSRPVSGVQTGICDSRDTLEECNDLIVARYARYARSDGLCSGEQTDDECHAIAVSSGLGAAPESTTIPDYIACTIFLDWWLKERELADAARLGRRERQSETVLPTARVDDIEEIREP